jgi:hypothetical protein
MKPKLDTIRFLAILATFIPALSGCGPEPQDLLSEEELEGKADAARTGRFEIFTGRDGRFYFHLLAGNGQKVLHSQGYASQGGARDGVTSVRVNAADLGRYRLLQAVDGQWYFNVVAGNGRVVGTSELYTTKSNAERAVATVMGLVKAAETGAAPAGARFQVFRGLDLQYYFHLRAPNGEILLQSEGYTRRTSAVSGVSSVRSNGQDAGRFEVREAANGQHYIVLKATNGRVIGRGELYASREGAERGVQAIVALLKSGAVANP